MNYPYLVLFILFSFCERYLQNYSYGMSFSEEAKCECGKYFEIGARIVGGKVSKPNEHPWMVAIFYDGKIHCGGSLINDRYILTAGHCLKWLSNPTKEVHDNIHEFINLRQRFKKEKLSVILGLHDRVVYENHRRGGIFMEVEDIIVHEKFSSNEIRDTDDIGLLKLKNTVEFNRKVKPVCLPTETGEDYSGTTANVAGWGKVSQNGGPSRFLKEAKLSVISNSDCRKIEKIGEYILDTMLCARQENVDACQGDSGGPLFSKTKKRRIEQIGIVSWGIGCAEPGIPGIYTRVTSYLEWIFSNTKDATYCKNS